MVYADWEYYGKTYLGNAISEDEYPRLSTRASQFLDYYTRGQAEKSPELEAVKMACCALAEQFQAIDIARALAKHSLAAAVQRGGAELQSETVGSHSETRRSGGDSATSAYSAAQAAERQLAGIARRYLAGTGLIYRGGRYVS